MSNLITPVASGHNWEILHGLMPEAQALGAGGELLEAINADNPRLVRKHTYENLGYSVFNIDEIDRIIEGDEKTALDFGITYPSKYIDEYRAQRYGYKGVMQTTAIINLIEPSGGLTPHLDINLGDLIFIGLLGVSVTVIEDPVTKELFTFEIAPGDAVVFKNKLEESTRPKHSVLNFSDEQRLSYGEYLDVDLSHSRRLKVRHSI